MPQIALGLVVLALSLWAMHAMTKANPRHMARGVRSAGGIGALLAAIALAATGRVAIAVPLGIAGLAMLGLWPGGWPGGFGGTARKSPGGVSRVRTAFVEMELDHDSGAMQGRVLAGPYEGSSLDALNVATLARLLGEIDEESQALLAAYLDRRNPRWRENANGGATAGRGTPPSGGPVTEQEAYQILGLQPGASPDEIGRAHRSLMKKLHPDQGGSTYLAARVNQAKDVLLRQHR